MYPDLTYDRVGISQLPRLMQQLDAPANIKYYNF